MRINKQINSRKFFRTKITGFPVEAYSIDRECSSSGKCLEAFTNGEHLYTMESSKGVLFKLIFKRYSLQYINYCNVVYFNN